MNTFEKMLATAGSAAQRTLIDAMLEWQMASDMEDAKKQIEAAPGEDLAGIKNSVIAGLTSLANSLGIGVEQFLEERRLQILSKEVMPIDVLKALDAIHLRWIEDNFTARRWAEKFFKGQLGQYRKTAKLPWSEVIKDFLFIKEYFDYTFEFMEEVEEEFNVYAKENDEDDDLQEIAEKARGFAPEIVTWIIKFRDKLDPVKKADQIKDINEFLAEHTDGAEIMEIMIKAASK